MSEVPPREELDLMIAIADIDCALATSGDYDPHEEERRVVLIDQRADLQGKLAMLRHRRMKSATPCNPKDHSLVEIQT